MIIPAISLRFTRSAQPVLVDVAAHHWNLSLDALCEGAGPATRAVIVSHLHGGIVPMRELTAWAGSRGIAVVEDAAQVPGARVQGRPAGTWGDAGVLSFGGSKLTSAGRGGALLTARADIAQRARTHILRGNLVCPLSELQAAALLPQLDRLDERNRQRAAAVCRLHDGLAGMRGVAPLTNCVAVCARCITRSASGSTRRRSACRGNASSRRCAEGIALAEGFAAAHVGRSPRRYRRGSDLGEAERAHHGAVILHHPVLLGTADELEQVVRAWRKVHAHRTRLADA